MLSEFWSCSQGKKREMPQDSAKEEHQIPPVKVEGCQLRDIYAKEIYGSLKLPLGNVMTLEVFREAHGYCKINCLGK